MLNNIKRIKTNANKKKRILKYAKMSLGGNDTYENKLVKIFRAKTKC